MTRISFPSFSGKELLPYEMRQLVSALELRFGLLERGSSFDLSVTDSRYAQLGHTHTESEISDLQPYLLNLNNESIFSLADVDGTPIAGDSLVWDGASFVPTTPGAINVFLDDLNDVNVPAPSDLNILRYDAGTNQWVASEGGEVQRLNDLLDVSTIGQAGYDLLFNEDGINWNVTNGKLIWNPFLQYLRLANDHAIDWLNLAAVDTELLIFNPVTVDPDFVNTRVVANFDGAHGDTVYTDETGNAYTFFGGAELRNTVVKFGPTSYYTGATDVTDYIEDATPPNLNPGSGDFTIEWWGYFPASQIGGNTWIAYGINTDACWRVMINNSLLGMAYCSAGSLENQVVDFGTVGAIDLWHHFAVERFGNTISGYANGVKLATTKDATGHTFQPTAAGLYFGTYLSGGVPASNPNGYIDSARVTMGTARYSGAASITVPTEAFPATGDEEMFVVGDPGYITQIDGTKIRVTGDLEVRDGQPLSVFDATNADSVTFSHNGTNFNAVGVQTTKFNITGIASLDVVNYEFDVDQAVGAGQDNYTLTYDNATGLISLEVIPVPTLITVTNESGDTTCFPAFFTALGTANLGPKVNSNFTFNSSTGDLNATLIAGIANANLVDKSAAETITGDWDFSNAASSFAGTAAIATTITVADEVTDATSFPLFTTAVGPANLGAKTNAGLTFNALTADLNSTLIAGIANANLLDKSAVEAITGAWTFGTAAQTEWLGGTDIWIRDAGFLRIHDSADTDWMQFEHNGTDFLMTGTNTAKLLVTGITSLDVVNYEFDVDQTLGAGQDNFVLTYDNATGTIQLEAAGAGSPTSLSTGTVTATTYGITSDGSADDVILVEATTAFAGLLGADKWDEIVANTAKVSNATHTGDVTGATTLTIDPTAISGKTLVTPVSTDMLLLWDATDSALKKVDASNFLAGAATTLTAGTVTATTYGITSDGSADDIILPEATTSLAGLLGSAKWNEIVANTAKVTNATHTGDVTGSVALTITADAVTNLMLANMAANTIKANATAGSADPADLAVGTNTVVGRVAGNIVAATLVNAQIATNTITAASQAQMAANTVKANATAGTANEADLAVGTNTVVGRVGSNIVAATLVDAQIATNTISNASRAQMAANTVKANATAGTANEADLAVGTNVVVGRVAGNIVAAQLATDQVADDAITYAKIQNVVSDDVFLGRISGAAGNIEELTGTQATSLLNVFTDTLKGLAPLSGGGTANFLRADGTWVTPAGGGNVSNTGTPLDNQVAVWTTATVIEGNAGLTWNGTTLEATQFGGIVNANLVDKSAAETISGDWTFTGNIPITLSSTQPDLFFNDTDAAADEGSWILRTNSGLLTFFNATDAAPTTGINGWFAAERVGSSVSNLTLRTAVRIEDTGATDYVSFEQDGTDLNVVGVNTVDINITGITAIQAGTVDADFDVITATSYGGILEANLVDKSVGEVITGPWAFGDGTGAPFVQIDGAAGQIRDLRLQTAGINRWVIRANTAAESGANAGSNFELLSRDDAGVAIGTALAITRSTMAATFAGTLSAVSYDGVLAANLLDKTAPETITGQYTFSPTTASEGPIITSAQPRLYFRETDGAADEKNYFFIANANAFELKTATDADPNTGVGTLLSFARTGTGAGRCTFENALTTVGNNVMNVDATAQQEVIRMIDTVSTNRMSLIWSAGGDPWNIRPYPLGVADATHDFLFDFTNDRWQFDRDIRFGAGPIIIGSTGLSFTGAIPAFTIGLRIADAGNTDYAAHTHDGTDANTTFVNTTEWNIDTVPVVFGQGSIYLTEKASAGADTAARGQVWVKNDAPNTVNFTDDSGLDYLLMPYVWQQTGADTAINSVTDVTIATKDITGVIAGDVIEMEAWFTILNDSTATRVYVITADFDGAFDQEFSTGACATGSTLRHTFHVTAVVNVRSTTVAIQCVEVQGGLAAGLTDSGNFTMTAGALTGNGWATTASNLTGTLTCALLIRSASATATQTCHLVDFHLARRPATV